MAKKKRIRNDSAALRKEYEEVLLTAAKFVDELSRQLSTLLEDNKIPLGFPIQSRIKTWDSLQGKLDKKSLQVSTIKELQDLIGFRIIVLFRRDLEKVTTLLDEHFEIVHKEDTSARLNESQFGYQSIHYVIQLPKEWFALPTLKGMAGLRTEVQVRTVAQHIWAASSHVLQYKHESSVPTGLRRTIHRVSALLETVDLEFERVVEENERYASTVKVNERDQELDVITLEKIISELLPPQNKDPGDESDYGELLEELRHKQVKTAGDLRDLLTRYLPELLKRDAKIAAELASKGGSTVMNGVPYGITPEDIPRVRRGVFWTHGGLTREALAVATEKR